LVPFWAKDIKVGFSNINAKAEGIEHKPAFRRSLPPAALARAGGFVLRVEKDSERQAALSDRLGREPARRQRQKQRSEPY
jgi:putative SOS response-associated peptidase YedK